MVLIHLLTMLHQFSFYTVTIVPTNYLNIVQPNVWVPIFTTQAKFRALLAVAVFMFKIEFWVKNARP